MLHNIYIYIYIYIYILYIHTHTHGKSCTWHIMYIMCPMYIWTVYVPKCMSCHKAIVGITWRMHVLIIIYIYYARLASVKFEHSVCHGSLTWNLPETGISKAWPDRKGVRSAGVCISFGCCRKKFYKNIVSNPPPHPISKSSPPHY